MLLLGEFEDSVVVLLGDPADGEPGLPEDGHVRQPIVGLERRQGQRLLEALLELDVEGVPLGILLSALRVEIGPLALVKGRRVRVRPTNNLHDPGNTGLLVGVVEKAGITSPSEWKDK